MFHYLKTTALALVVFFVFTSCSKRAELIKLEGFAQGTTYHLTFFTSNPVDQVAVQTAVDKEFARIDAALSNYRDDSAIEHFNAAKTTEPVDVDAELVTLVETARRVHLASQGCYDLTIKPLFDLWGFKKNEFSPPDDLVLRETLKQVGMEKLETLGATQMRKQRPELRVDVSSIGQGHSVARISNVLEGFGAQNYLVEIGGELKIRGRKPNGEPWRIALEKPLPGERKLHKVVSFDSGEPMALMTSGTYRHYFDQAGKRYSHILDARSGRPVEHSTVAVTVLHTDPAWADAWSTAFLCLGSEQGMRVAEAESIAALFIDQAGEELIEHSSQALQKLKDVSFPEK